MTLGDRWRAAFQQRIGRYRCAKPDGANRIMLGAVFTQERGDAGGRCIDVAFGLFGEQLGADQMAVGTTGDDVGEGPAAIDPELPARALIARARHDRLP